MVVLFAWFIMTETKQKTLEELNQLLGK